MPRPSNRHNTRSRPSSSRRPIPFRPSETTHPGFRRCGLGVSRSTIYHIPVVAIVYTPTTAMNRTALSLFRASKKWAKFSNPAECAAVRGQTQGIDRLV